jgi:Putative transposase
MDVLFSDPAACSVGRPSRDGLSSALQIAHRIIPTFLIKQSGVKRSKANTGAVTLIQRFGSAANLSIHLHCLVLDGAYRSRESVSRFHEAREPAANAIQDMLLAKIVLRMLISQGHLIEELGVTYLAEADGTARSRRYRRPRALTALR